VGQTVYRQIQSSDKPTWDAFVDDWGSFGEPPRQRGVEPTFQAVVADGGDTQASDDARRDRQRP
jgi:hypothetical protein